MAEFYENGMNRYAKAPRVKIPYIYSSMKEEDLKSSNFLETILDTTPTKGQPFSSVHIVHPPKDLCNKCTNRVLEHFREKAGQTERDVYFYALPEKTTDDQPIHEYEAIFEMASGILLNKASRSSLLIFVGSSLLSYDAYGALIGMLPFRGMSTALISQASHENNYDHFLRLSTPSGTFMVDADNSARMGMYPLSAIYGPMGSKNIEITVEEWSPIEVPIDTTEDIAFLPFKIGGLRLPMFTHNGDYEEALARLGVTIREHYKRENHNFDDFDPSISFFPIVSCGETCEALGYGADVLDAIGASEGYLFTHKSTETYKRYDNYGSTELFSKIMFAKRCGLTPLIIAVGGGVNGNSIGLIASLTGSDFIEVPTTAMHYNDATTSAKKAMSLVVDDKILSKNIMGAFYLPRMVYCVNDMLLTMNQPSLHATVGEACKSMNMLGIASSQTGAQDYHNIVGAHEFASDFTKIVDEVKGFEDLEKFITSPSLLAAKEEVLAVGREIKLAEEESRQVLKRSLSCVRKDSSASVAQIFELQTGFDKVSIDTKEHSLIESECSDDSIDSIEVSENRLDIVQARINELKIKRKTLMSKVRSRFHDLPEDTKASMKSFLTVINKEIISAKAMFLAYSDPFEKYRALLFEYAHTLGHGIEAFANLMYERAAAVGIHIPPDARKLHGQCVGMAVQWAGDMSRELNLLAGPGLIAHQAFVYTFNNFGGFCFKPLRELCDTLGISREELIEGVLAVVRRDNKRGYCKCEDGVESVDQLVVGRPGKMVKSTDAAAELRYLITINEKLQRNVLSKAFDGEFDKVADLRDGELVFIPYGERREASADQVAKVLRSSLQQLYSDQCMTCA